MNGFQLMFNSAAKRIDGCAVFLEKSSLGLIQVLIMVDESLFESI